MNEVIITKKRKGRYTVQTPERAEIICKSLARGLPYNMACAVAGISFQTFSVWRNRDDKFRQQIEEAIAHGVAKRLEKIERAAEQGEWRAACWLLEHTQPEHFSRSRIQVEAVGQLEHSFVIPQQTLNEIAQARAKLDEHKQHQAIEATPA